MHCARIWGGNLRLREALIAAEEARSGAGREHAQVAAWSNDARTAPGPALDGWCLNLVL
jgi:hypothetical protein